LILPFQRLLGILLLFPERKVIILLNKYLPEFYMLYIAVWWAGYFSRYSDWLRAGRSGDRIPGRGEIFRACPDRPWGPFSLLYNAYRVFSGGKERPERDADPSPPSSAVVYSPYGPYGLYSASVPVQ
jgi:hypothetical protein